MSGHLLLKFAKGCKPMTWILHHWPNIPAKCLNSIWKQKFVRKMQKNIKNFRRSIKSIAKELKVSNDYRKNCIWLPTIQVICNVERWIQVCKDKWLQPDLVKLFVETSSNVKSFHFSLMKKLRSGTKKSTDQKILKWRCRYLEDVPTIICTMFPVTVMVLGIMINVGCNTFPHGFRASAADYN